MASALPDQLSQILEFPKGFDLLEDLIIDLGIMGKLSLQEEWPDVENDSFPQKKFKGQIPRHWGELNFGQHLDIRGGGQPPKSTFVGELREGYTRLYQIRDYGPNPVPTYVPSNLVTRRTVKGDLLIARYGASAKIFWAEEGAYNVALAKFIYPSEVLIPEFAYLLLKSSFFKSPVLSTTRVAVDGFNKNDLKNVHFPLPPLSEQKSIVTKVNSILNLSGSLKSAKLELSAQTIRFSNSAISGITSSQTSSDVQRNWGLIKQNWRVMADNQEQVGSLRTLILDLALKGLIAPNLKDDLSAGELVRESILAKRKKLVAIGKNSELAPFEVPKHWVWSTISEMCETQTGATPKPIESDDESIAIQYITAADMLKLRAVKNNFIPLEAAKRTGRIAPANSVLFVGIGATIGKCCLTENDSTFNQQIHAATPLKMDSEFLSLVLVSDYFQKLCKAKTNATAIPILNKSKWESFKIPIPPLAEQRLIVQVVTELFDLCGKLEDGLTEADMLLEKFAKSALFGASG